jgi:AAA family ATP:ADP antiporter
VKAEPGEGPALLWAGAYFFCLLSSYYVIRPVRDALGVSGGVENLAWLYMGTLGGTLAANPVFSAVVSRWPRRVFIPVVYRFLILNLLVFYALLTGLPEAPRALAARVFFVWVSVFNLFAVSVFWGFMADMFRSDQGKRLFGFIGMGGTLGAVAGAALTTSLAEAIGPMNLLLVSAALLEAAVRCVRRLVRHFGVDAPGSPAGAPAAEAAPPPPGPPPPRDAAEGAPPGHGALSGIRLVARSPYLLAICLFLFFYTVSSTFLYFEQARIVGEAVKGSAERTAFFARIDLYVNLLTVVTQCFFTGRIIAAIGVGGALCVLPVLTMGGLAALGASPTAGVLVVLQTVRRAAEFAVIRPAREVLFTVVTREEKYASKNLIDTFVYRGGDLIGAWTDRLLALLSVGAPGRAGLFLPLAAAWVLVAVFLGRRQGAMARRAEMTAPV